jgi:hypothetical protein
MVTAPTLTASHEHGLGSQSATAKPIVVTSVTPVGTYAKVSATNAAVFTGGAAGKGVVFGSVVGSALLAVLAML